MSHTAIRVDRVSKRFKLYRDPITGPVLEFLCFWKRAAFYREFLAVDDVSLEVKRGEVVGIIGPNGAGKTTLLKMIAGLLPVDRGRIEVQGRVTALLALGVGVHPEFSGRENIVFSGMLLGMSRSEVRRKLDEIIEFSGLGDFVDRPLRTYSTGMRARLLFSVFSAVEPEILIIDEALATGDAVFVERCVRRIREICSSGATVLFVSHNLTQVQQLCHRAVLLADHRLRAEGSPAEVIAAYNQWTFERQSELAQSERPALVPVSGTGEVAVTGITLKDASGRPALSFHSGDEFVVEIEYETRSGQSISGASVFVGFLVAATDTYVGEMSTRYFVDGLGQPVRQAGLDLAPRGVITLRCESLLLLNNHYRLWVMFHSERGTAYCEYRGVCPFFVARKALATTRGPVFWQPFRIEARAA